MTTSGITFKPISSVGGAEILGLDLHQEPTETVKRCVKNACLEYCFLLLRNQDITLDEQLKFGSVFGNVLENGGAARNGSFVTSTGEVWLHFDHWLISGHPEPVRFTMLYSMKVVPTGGETIFANARLAYQELPDQLKKQIDELRALHCYDYSYGAAKKIELRIREANIDDSQPRAVHPVVIVHPEIEKKVLYVSPRNTDRILGLQAERSEALLQELCAYFMKPDSIYAHRWQVGDLLIWDNYSMLHGRRDFQSEYERKLRRMCIL
jgi:taurine dioxygenase